MRKSHLFPSLHLKVATVAAALFISASLQASDCTYELFSINGAKGMSISDYIEQLSSECELSLIISDTQAEAKMHKLLHRLTLKNMTLPEILDILLVENNLNYSLTNNILKISFIETKTYNIDYIISARKSIGSTDVMLSNSSGGTGSGMSGNTSTGSKGKSGGSVTNASGIQIQSLDEVKFWEELDVELERVLNRPTDFYQAEKPIVNKNAGLVTVTATVRQQQRLEKYLTELQKKIQHQVLIDVRMLAVTLNDESSTGVDWSQIYALQNMAVTFDQIDFKNVSTFSGGEITAAGTTGFSGPASMLRLSSGGTIDQVIKFLKTQGDVDAISNPKVLTLNNQPALITVGTEYFYKLQQSNILAGSSSGTSTTTNNEQVSSIFAGVLLDITPEIANDDTITLKINPSVSQTRITLSSDEASQQQRSMPPDLDRRQLASVVTVKDGNRIVIGGLIDKQTHFKTNKVPLLGDIPGLGYAFRYEEKTTQNVELVIIIEPHIIRKENDTLSLSDLGYSELTDETAGLNQPKEINDGANGKK